MRYAHNPRARCFWQREVLSSSDMRTFCAIRDWHAYEENYQTPTKSLLFGASQDTSAFLLQSHISQNACDGDSRTTDIGLVLILTKLYGFLPPVPCRSIYWIRVCIHTLNRVRLVFTGLTQNGFDNVVVLFSRPFDKRVNWRHRGDSNPRPLE